MRPRNGKESGKRPLPLGAPNITDRPYLPPKLTIHCVETSIPFLPDSATPQLPHTASPFTDTSGPTGATHQILHGSGMRLRAPVESGALPHPHVDRQWIAPTATSQAKTHGRGGTDRGREQNSGGRPGDGGGASQVHCPILNGRKCPSLKIPRHIEYTTRASILTAYPAPPHACPRRDTREDPSELTCLLRSLLGTDIRTIEMVTLPSPNEDSP